MYIMFWLRNNPKIFIRLQKSAIIIIVPESMNIYRFKAIIEMPNFNVICVCMYLQISDLYTLDNILWRLCDF